MVFVLVTCMRTAKTAEPIDMPFVGLTRLSPRNHVLVAVEILHEKGQFWGLSGPLH